MSLAAIQAEMKSRIEEECKKQMMALLEDSFSKKMQEYTSSVLEADSIDSKYAKNYGKIDLTIDSILSDESVRNNWFWENVDSRDRAFKQQLVDSVKKIQFASDSIYIIHYMVKVNMPQHGSNRSWDLYLIDNYGYTRSINYNSNNASYTPAGTTIVYKNDKDIYPLPNVLIDKIKKFPTCVKCSSWRSVWNGQFEYISGDNPNVYLDTLPDIQKIAAEQGDIYNLISSIKKENSMLKARVAELEARLKRAEASPPTEDLLGLSGGCAAQVNDTEPSRYSLVETEPSKL